MQLTAPGTCRAASMQASLRCRTSSRVSTPCSVPLCALQHHQQHQLGVYSTCRRGLVSVHVFDKLKGWFGGKDPAGSEDEDAEAGTMIRLEADSVLGIDGGVTAFGPPTVLLVAFSRQEMEVFRNMMLEMEADFFKISHCTRAMLDMTLKQALEQDCPPWEQAPVGTRRAVVLSGMLGGEVVDVVAAYKEVGLPSAVFAVAVPKNMGRQVRDLLQEVVAEDVAMKRNAAERAAQQQQQ